MSGAAAAKIVLAALSNEKLRKSIGWTLTAIFSPLILLIVLLCSMASGESAHNNQTVAAVFYGTAYSEKIPAEFKEHIEEMKLAFSRLDAAVASVNSRMEHGSGLDPLWVKAVFYALCFGEEAPSRRESGRFVQCFCTIETRTRTAEVTLEDGTVVTEKETYTVTVPASREQSFHNLAGVIGRTVTEDDRKNSEHIYSMVGGTEGSSGGNGTGGLRGDGSSIELDVSAFTDASHKNAADLAVYAVHAWENGWGYVWGTYGEVLTESMLEYKVSQYPDGVGQYEEFIRANWLGGRTTDCVGLIKGYGWLNSETMSIDYGTNGMPDVSANQMYYSASVSGPIGTIPEVPGIAVWHDGHIGVYIGNGEVIEAMSTTRGVRKTKLTERNWTHWLQVPYITYD